MEVLQNVLGWLVVKITKAHNRKIYWIATKHTAGWYGVSLGKYIIFTAEPKPIDWYHELGHQRQSRILGVFYLLLIGMPSVLGNLLQRKLKYDYYRQPWEAWADKLGGIKRDTEGSRYVN